MVSVRSFIELPLDALPPRIGGKAELRNACLPPAGGRRMPTSLTAALLPPSGLPMSYILTLIAARDRTTLSAAAIAKVREAVRGGAPDILSPGEAADIPLPAAPDMQAVRASL